MKNLLLRKALHCKKYGASLLWMLFLLSISSALPAQSVAEEPVLLRESTLTPAQVKRLAATAAKNPECGQVMMGSYVPHSSASYNRRAGTEYTYFELDNWDSLYQQVGRDYEEMWKIGTQFMDDQLKQKKAFYFSHDPNNPRSRGFLRELWYLKKKKKGVRFIQEGDALWKAVW